VAEPGIASIAFKNHDTVRRLRAIHDEKATGKENQDPW
jgi:hypothetical protein